MKDPLSEGPAGKKVKESLEEGRVLETTHQPQEREVRMETGSEWHAGVKVGESLEEGKVQKTDHQRQSIVEGMETGSEGPTGVKTGGRTKVSPKKTSWHQEPCVRVGNENENPAEVKSGRIMNGGDSAGITNRQEDAAHYCRQKQISQLEIMRDLIFNNYTSLEQEIKTFLALCKGNGCLVNAEVEWLLALKQRLQSGLQHQLSAAIVSQELRRNQPVFIGNFIDADSEFNMEQAGNVSKSSEELEKEDKSNGDARSGKVCYVTSSESVMNSEPVMTSESVFPESIILDKLVVAEKAVNPDDAAVPEPTVVLDDPDFIHEETQRRHSIFLAQTEPDYKEEFEKFPKTSTLAALCRAKTSLDPDIHDKLDVSPVSHLTKKSSYDTEVLFLNVLVHEVGQVLLGPVKENLDIFSRRCSYKSFWRKHVESLKPRYPEKYVSRKVRELLRFLHDDENVNLTKQAMINLGITMVISDDFLKKKHSAIDETTRESPSRNVPDYLMEDDKDRRNTKDLTLTSNLRYNKNLESCNGENHGFQHVPEEGVFMDEINTRDCTTTTSTNVGESSVKDKSESYVNDKSESDCQDGDGYDSSDENEIIRIAKSIGTIDEVFKYIPPEKFTFSIPGRDVEAMYDFEKEKFKSGVYAVVVDKYMNETQKCCAFISKYVPSYAKKISAYCYFYGKCGCGLKFNVTVVEKPTKGKDLLCAVCTTGNFKLIQKNPVGRPVKGHARHLLKKELLHISSARAHLKRLLKASIYRTLHHNHPERSEAVLKMIKAEAKQHDSKLSDPLEDLKQFANDCIKTDSEKAVKGYIQFLECLPDKFNVKMYTQESLQLLNSLQKKEEIILHIDATGSVVTQKGLTAKKVFLYVVLARSKNYTFPVAEALSQRGTAMEIGELLSRLKQDAKLLKKNLKRLVGAAVSDFSFAMIHGLLRGLNNMTLEDYLLDCFNVLQNKKVFSENRTVIFLCTAHLIHSFSSLLRKHVRKDVIHIACHSLAKLQETCTLGEFSSVARLVCYLFDSEYLEKDELDGVLAKLTKHGFDMDSIENLEVVEELMDEFELTYYNTLRDSSPFFHLFRKEWEISMQRTNSSKSANPFYCKRVIILMLENYVPYTPLFASMMLKKTNRSSDSRLTNAAIEADFNIVKNNYHMKARTAVNLFVRSHFDYHRGKLTKVLLSAQKQASMRSKGKPRSGTTRLTCKNNKAPTTDGERSFTEASKTGSKISNRKSDAIKEAFAKESWRKHKKSSKTPRYFSATKSFTNESVAINAESTSPGFQNKIGGVVIQGLVNLGNSCFINSLLQALLALPSISDMNICSALKFAYHLIYARKELAEPSVLQDVISLLAVQLQDGDVSPRRLKEIQIDVRQQQDPHEYFLRFNQSKKVGLADVFRVTFISTLSCKSRHQRKNEWTEYDLVCGTNMCVGESSLTFTSAKEDVEVSCGFQDCKENRMFSETVVKNGSKFLCLREEIFTFRGNAGEKKPKCQQRTVLAPDLIVTTQQGEMKYQLCSIIVHNGGSIDTGHYVTYIATDGYWIRCDDQTITTRPNAPNLEHEDLYLSFYRQIV